MISKIILNDVASYRKEAVLDTDKKVNLIYGLNGTGKSTFSGLLYNQNDPKYTHCKIEGLEDDDTVLVYNQKFIQDVFYEQQGIQGIFTLSKNNAKVQKIIDEANTKKEELIKRKKIIEERIEDNKKKHLNDISEYKNQVWKIKTEYGSNSALDFCLDGYKGNKDNLFKHLVSIERIQSELDFTIDDLIKDATQLHGGASAKNHIIKVQNSFESIEESKILSKVILGNRDSSVASLIETLGNSEWVAEGIKYIHKDKEKCVCPFCQQDTINQLFVEQIEAFFDTTYKQDKKHLEQIVSEYSSEMREVLNYLLGIQNDDFTKEYKQSIEKHTEKLNDMLEKNLNLLKKKLEAPSCQVILYPVAEILMDINSIIEKVNDKIDRYNNRLENVEKTKKEILNKFWQYMRKKYDPIIELYEKNVKKYEKLIAIEQTALQKINDEIREQDGLIRKNRKQTVNVNDAVDNINNALLDIGITNFKIETYSESDSLYRLQRFIELCKGESTANKVSRKKIVVIDDPISSLSHIYVFNIGRLIHNEFLRTKKYDQVFILTHSLYFFYELTNTKHSDREKTQKLFRICKNSETSYFEVMKYEEIQNDYQAYWSIIKDEKQSPALIANCMRNIIEYFFNFVEK